MNINKDLAKRIDHTILKANTTAEQITQLCEEAKQYGFAAVCVPLYFVKQAADLLKDSEVVVATVIGFPLGYTTLNIKRAEILESVLQGANEIDMVINIAAVKSGDWDTVVREIRVINQIAKMEEVILKVIIETALLTDEEIIFLCQICEVWYVDYVKTSTGFSTAGAKVEHIQLMRKNLPERIKIKASGGIRTAEFAQQLVDAGADRLGTSSGVKLVTEG